MVVLDYCKAFDSIDKAFLQKGFEVFGFGVEFQKWVKVLMESNYSSVQHNGWLSEWFPTESGIRRSCPFSPLCFFLAVEILAIKIRQANIIKAYCCPLLIPTIQICQPRFNSMQITKLYL